MTTNDLPKGNSPDLRLISDATAEENLAQLHANSSEWRGALSLEAYLKREELLVNQDLTKDGGLTPWFLVYQPEGTKDADRQVLCGCESIKKKALIARNGKVKEVVAHGIASVFCPETMRGRGYAGRMMTEVGTKLEGWQAGDAGSAFSVLYSDIGKDFYAARGWKPFPSSHIALPASADMPSGIPSTQPLKAQDLAELCKLDEQLLQSRLSQLASDGKTSAALVPDVRTLDWHHAREDFIAKELHNRHPEIKGAVAEHDGKRTWCIWTRVWTNPNEEAGDTLHILRLASEDPSFADFEPGNEASAQKMQDTDLTTAIAALFAAAQREAKEWSMDHVELWNPTSLTLAAARKVISKAEIVHRERESIASLRWYGEGDGSDVRWVCNEKFGWC